MDLGLHGRSAAITGGSKGIGFAIAQELARKGVDLHLAARNSRDLETAATSWRRPRQVSRDWPASRSKREALFTLGDKPELRYRAAREELAALGHPTTISYLAEMAALVMERTGLLAHVNPGVTGTGEIADLRRVSVSQGIMLETAAERLSHRGGPHFRCPDKQPARRLEMIRAAGETAVPFTSGILIGVGETRRERLEALLRLRELQERYGHPQEIIIQNFVAKPRTRMARHPEPELIDHLWTIAAARILFGPDMNIQAPPNLASGALHHLVAAGINARSRQSGAAVAGPRSA